MVRVFVYITKDKGSNLMGGVVCDQQWYVIEYSFIEFLE
jgi:hypothetical protein